MTRQVLGIIIGIAAIGTIGAVVIANNRDVTPTINSPSPAGMPMTDQTQSMSGETVITNSVTIDDFEYKPDKITIKKGTTVTWTNNDSAGHDITPENPSDAFKASKLLKKGESYSFKFETPGTYNYYCSPHPYMKGVVEVTE